MITFDYKRLELGFTEKNEQTSVSPYTKHMHNSWEFYFLKSGKVDYNIETTVYDLIPNDFLVIPPRQYHVLIRNKAETYGRFVVNFYEDMLSPHIVKLLGKLNRHYHIPRDSTIDKYFSDILKNNKCYSSDEMYTMVKNCVELIILDLSYNNENAIVSTTDKDTFFESVVEFIDKNIALPVTTDDLCKQFFVSRSFLFHGFRAKFNISVNQYINLRKVVYAQKLINEGASATEACYAVGFKDYSTFYRRYKTLLGNRPEDDKKSSFLKQEIK